MRKKSRAKRKPLKLYVVRTYIFAKDGVEAARKAKKVNPDDVFIDTDWKEGKNNNLADAIGYEHYVEEEEDDIEEV